MSTTNKSGMRERYSGNSDDISGDDREFLLNVMGPDMRALARAAGIEAALSIMCVLGGNGIYIPVMEDLQRALRDEKIRNDYAVGRSVRDISRLYGLSARTVYKILKQEPSGISGGLEGMIERYSKNRASF